MRRDPRLIAVPVVVAIVAITWIADATLPSSKGAAATASSVVAIRQAELVCPQAGGPGDNGGLGEIAYADAGGPDQPAATSPASPPPVNSAPVSSPPVSSAPASSAPGSSAAVSSRPGSSGVGLPTVLAAPGSAASVGSHSASPAGESPAVASSTGSPVSPPVSPPASSPAASPASPPTSPAASPSTPPVAAANPLVSSLWQDGLGFVAPAVPIAVQPRSAWTIPGPYEQLPVRLAVGGPLTDNLGAVQINRDVVESVPQLSATPCSSPTTDAWFAGFSSVAGAHTTLYLSNVDTAPAAVDVSVWGNVAGAPEVKRGVIVAPQSQVTIALDQFSPGLSAGVAHVTATSGRVAAAVRYDAENGSVPLGVDWIPPTGAPATTQTVPGFAAGDGPRTLVLADTGQLDATVSVNVVTSDGAFSPTDLATVTVPAGSVSETVVDADLQQEPATLVVSSTQPVVAAGISALPLDGNGASDLAFTASTPALSGPVVMSGGEVSATQHTLLVLSAPNGDAHAKLTVLPSIQELPIPLATPTDAAEAQARPFLGPQPSPTASTSEVTIPDGTTVEVDLAALTHDPAPAVVITPGGGGPLFAAWLVEEDGTDGDSGDITEIPLVTPVRSLGRPPAGFDPAVGLP